MANISSLNIDIVLNLSQFKEQVQAVISFLNAFKTTAADLGTKPAGEVDKLTDALRAFDQEIKKTDTEIRKTADAHSTAAAAVGKHGEALVTLQSKLQNIALRVQGLQSIMSILKGTFGDMLAEYNKQEIALAKLNNGLKNIGESAGALDKLVKQSEALQEVTPFADEEIQNAQAMLTTFMKSSEEIEILTPRIVDLAAAYMQSGESGMNLQQVAVMLGKVNEETTGALRRVGVAFSEEQEEKLKSLKGTEQAIYLSQILDQNFKGMANTVGNTAAGQMKILQNKLGDMKESFGKIIAEGLAPFLNIFKPIVEWISKAPPWVQTLAVGIMALAAAFVVLNTSMGAIPYIIGGIVTVIASLAVGLSDAKANTEAFTQAQLKNMQVSKDMQKLLDESGISANNLSDAYQNLSDNVIYMGKAQLQSARDFLSAEKMRIEGAIGEAKVNAMLYYSRFEGIESMSGRTSKNWARNNRSSMLYLQE